LEDHGVDGIIILAGYSQMGCEGMDWFVVAQERDRCRALVNAVMNLAGNFLTS